MKTAFIDLIFLTAGTVLCMSANFIKPKLPILEQGQPVVLEQISISGVDEISVEVLEKGLAKVALLSRANNDVSGSGPSSLQPEFVVQSETGLVVGVDKREVGSITISLKDIPLNRYQDFLRYRGVRFRVLGLGQDNQAALLNANNGYSYTFDL